MFVFVGLSASLAVVLILVKRHDMIYKQEQTTVNESEAQIDQEFRKPDQLPSLIGDQVASDIDQEAEAALNSFGLSTKSLVRIGVAAKPIPPVMVRSKVK